MEFFNNPGYQEERDYRIKVMSKYQINRENLGKSNPFIMHDMPIHPGFEIEEELIESEKSIIYTQGENRMHVEKALVQYLLSEH